MLVPDVALADASDEFVCGVWKNVVIYAMYSRVNANTLRRIAGVHASVKKKHRRTLSVSISVGDVGSPDAETRKLATEMIGASASDDVITAIVLEGKGMWVATARSLVTGMFLLSRSMRRNRVFSSLEEAAAWLAPLSEPVHAVEELAAALHLVRSTKPKNNAKLGLQA